MSKFYEYFQPNQNSVNDEAEDCFIRAICAVTGKTWQESYKGIFSVAVKHNRLSADVVNIGSYLESIGFERYICYTGDAKPTVREYLKRARKKLKVCDAKVRKRIKEAKFVFIGEGHAVGSHDLKYYDTWDCGDIRITEIYAKFPK